MKIKIKDNNDVKFGVRPSDNIKLSAGDVIITGSSDYEQLENLPSIEGVTLIGDISLDEIGAAYESDIPVDVSELNNDAGYIKEADIPTDVSAFNNDAGYLTSESDPTVPAWAKEENKPSYTASEVGALPDTTPRIFSGTSDTAAATTEKAVVCPEFKASDLKVGTMILVSFDNTNSGAVGSITLNVNGTGPKPIKRNNSGTIGNLDSAGYIKANSTYPFIYDGANWVTWYDTNTNTIGYTIRTNGLSLPMKSITYRYRILFTSSDGNYYVPANNSTSTNATASRTVCQDKIDPFGRIVYYGTTASVAAGSRPSASYQYQQYTGITLGYSFNRTGAALTLTAWKPVYIKCTPQTDGSAIIDATTPYVQDLPTTNDGFIYIFLGVATAATTIEMTIEHSVYYHDGTRIRLYT